MSPDAHTADLIICAARTGDSANPDQGISLFAVDRESAGLDVTQLQTLDQTRRLYEVAFDGVLLPESRILGEAGQAWPVLETVLDKAAIGLSAEMVGGAQRMLDLSVEYSKERVQFGRPIGSFQAIQHKCADMLIYTEGARSAVYAAAWAASQEKEDLAVQASIAKALHQRRLSLCRRRRNPDPRGYGVYLGRRPPSVPETSQVSRSGLWRRHLPPGADRWPDRALNGFWVLGSGFLGSLT